MDYRNKLLTAIELDELLTWEKVARDLIRALPQRYQQNGYSIRQYLDDLEAGRM